MKPCLVQSSYLTISWLPLQSVGTAYAPFTFSAVHQCSRRLRAMLKSHGLTHLDRYTFDIDSTFCECQTMEKRVSRMFD